MSWLSTRRACAFTLASAVTLWGSTSNAEIPLGEAAGWAVSTDGRVNSFVSHIFGDNRPAGLESLPWVGFNESGNPGQAEGDGKLRRTRIRGGYVPSTLAFNFKKQTSYGAQLSVRTEIGMQIANLDPNKVANPTWMDPRAVYFDIADSWGSVKAGRDFGLFARSNLFMNYELGHAYGVGFPCAYEAVFGGACGHVGFGTLWPDFHAQLTYSTPKFFDAFQVSAGAFDPRSVPTYSFVQTPLPRFEGEAVVDYRFQEGWGFKTWVNGAYQEVGLGSDNVDPVTFQTIDRETFTLTAAGVGYGLLGYLGPVKLGVSGYRGKGMDGFEFLGFNPIYVGQDGALENRDRRFRPTSGLLAEASLSLFNFTLMGGWGQASLERVATDAPLDTVDQFPLLRSQTGISAGLSYRIDEIVLSVDYFNAHYGFDPKLTTQADGAMPRYVEVEQSVNIINGGVTVEW